MYKVITALLIAVILLSSPLESAAFPFKSFIVDTLTRSGCSPYEVHLAFGNSADEVSVSWRTNSNDCSSSVRYGPLKRSDYDGDNSAGGMYTITEKNMCQAPASSTPFTVVMHSAIIYLTSFDEEYWYRLGNDDTEFRFRSPKPPSASLGLRFVALADSGAKSAARETMSRIQDLHSRSPIDSILHIGDLSYADGRYKRWDSFMSLIEPISSEVPYMVGVGNHEYDYLMTKAAAGDLSGKDHYVPNWGNFNVRDSGGECGAMTALRFRMPEEYDKGSWMQEARQGREGGGINGLNAVANEVQGRVNQSTLPISPSSTAPVALKSSNNEVNAPFWYSYDNGAVHFVVLSSEHDLSSGSAQRRWFEDHLTNDVDRCRTPWLVVAHHRPMYVVYPHKDNRMVGEHLKDIFEDLLIQNHVDVTISGHVHSYYRTCAVRNDKCDSKAGVTHLVVGSAGHSLSGVTGSQEDWVKSSLVQFGFGVFTIEREEEEMLVEGRGGEVADKKTLEEGEGEGKRKERNNVKGGIKKDLEGERGDEVLHFQFILNKDGSVGDEVFIKPKITMDTCHLYGNRKKM
mmetsp:Transcript_1795/g.2594  ORF Transcript_1795/g.2594 Transcript_1795/m.2594 type:complete len:571 (-) Transcript_1795:484-2196(-)